MRQVGGGYIVTSKVQLMDKLRKTSVCSATIVGSFEGKHTYKPPISRLFVTIFIK